MAFSEKAYSSYYWQISGITGIDSGGSYCQNSTAKPIHLAVVQCSGGGSKPHNSTTVNIKWYKNRSNSNSGGTLVDDYNYYTQALFAYSILYTPPTQDTGTMYFYAVISNPSMTTCGFTDSLVSNTIAIHVTAAEDARFHYTDKTFCSGSTNPSATITGVSGGMFSSSSITDLDTINGNIDITKQSIGQHFITYTSNGSCPGTYTDTITVISQPDSNIVISGFDIKAVDTTATYLWKRCSDDQTINGQNGFRFTPAQNGSYYALIIKGACEVKSNCIEFKLLSLSSSSKNDGHLNIYPNPADKTLNLSKEAFGLSYRIVNLQGQTMIRGTVSESSQIDIQLLNNGLYLIQFEDGTYRTFEKK